jgi:cytochrome c biogenesis protein CcmG/thiol:disulfide interchange protein DsbE
MTDRGRSAPARPAGSGAAETAPAGRRGRLLLAGATVALAVVVGLVLAGRGGSGRSAPPPLAKNFTIPVLGHPGQRLSLSAYQGKPLILNFFASWCHPCQQETPLLARFYRSHHGQVQIIGIAVNDPVQPALAFVRKTGVSYPVGTDSPPNTATAYDVSGLPQTFFLNAQHRIVKRVLGAVTARQLSAGTALIEPRAK